MESWRKVWQEGIAPLLPTAGLEALANALEEDDPTLIRGATTSPQGAACLDWPCQGACAIGYAGWKWANLKTVGEVEEFFARTCFEADNALGEPAVRWFLNWADETPREEMRLALLPEVWDELRRREGR